MDRQLTDGRRDEPKTYASHCLLLAAEAKNCMFVDEGKVVLYHSRNSFSCILWLTRVVNRYIRRRTDNTSEARSITDKIKMLRAVCAPADVRHVIEPGSDVTVVIRPLLVRCRRRPSTGAVAGWQWSTDVGRRQRRHRRYCYPRRICQMTTTRRDAHTDHLRLPA